MTALFFILSLCGVLCPISTDYEDYLRQAVFLLGAGSEENLGEQEQERVYRLYCRPMPLNSSSSSDLLSTGFFTPFQVSSILDYRERNGDILSEAELGSVVGIGPQMARALSCFLSFESALLPSRRLHESLDFKESMCNSVKNGQASSRFRLSMDCSKGWSGALTCTDALQSAFLRYRGKGLLSELIVGSFNARFGQGLVFSSAFSISGVQTIGALSRNPTGIAGSCTSNSAYALEGIGLSFRLGRANLQALSSFRGDVQAMNLSFLTEFSTYAMTFSRSGETLSLGADAKSTLGRFTLWTEAALSLRSQVLSCAAIAGTYYNIGYKRRAALCVRSYGASFSNPYASALRTSSSCSDQSALDVGIEYDDFSFLVDMSFKPSSGERQAKIVSSYTWPWQASGWDGSVECRLNSRFSMSPRNEARLTANVSRGVLSLSSRVQVLKGEKMASLFYVHSQLTAGEVKLALRVSCFDARLWNDRIYGYSPDVPGYFSVKAYYGRGVELTVYLKTEAASLRIGYTAYADGKSPRLEARLLTDLKISGLRPSRRPSRKGQE